MNKKIAFALTGIAIAILAFVLLHSSSKEKASPAVEQPVASTTPPLPEETYTIQGQEHIAIGTSHIEYNSNPPTSGPHYIEPANWGFYDKELPDEQLVHSLEHGGIWISYKDVDSDTLSALENIARMYPGSVIVTPRAKNDTTLILASWGKLQRMNEYDKSTILQFIKANKNKSPEPIAQ